MAENVEEIEAKLAAYVDGELTPAERVEIETHLTNNPSHRELLQDLVLHRNLLRSIPREKAPGDCTEGFQGQLERDILLGGDELSRARNRFRIHYSPQLLSAAAIILVAVALGIIVYTVLPPHQPQAPIAHLSTEPNKGVDALSESSTGPVADARAFKADTGEVMARKGVAAKMALNDESLGQKLDEPRFGGGFGGSGAQRQQIAAGDMMVITVTADDVQRANDAVVSYLDLNKINYTAEAQGFWKDGVEAVAAGRRLAGGMPGGGGGGAVSGGASLETAGAAQVQALRANDQLAKREERLDRSRVDSLRTDPKAETTVVAQQEEKKLAEDTVALRTAQQPEERYAKLAARPSPAQAQPTPSPTTQPSATARGGVEVLNDTVTVSGKYAAGGTAGGAGVALLKQQQLRDVQLDQDSAACVILARDMNDQQVRELARSLSQPERNLYATVQMDRSDSYRRTALASLARSGENEAKDLSLAYRQQAVQLKVNEAVREKVVAANAPAVIGPATRPAEEFALNIKADDAGLSRGEADVAARINGTTTGTISPSDYAFAEAVQQPQLPGQQQAFFGITPTTQPGWDARQNLFTCVIVVQNSTSAAKASGPATQPIAGKPATTAPTNPPPAAGEPAK